MSSAKIDRKKQNSSGNDADESVSAEESATSSEDTIIQLTFRCPKEIIDVIDEIRAKRKGKISRNQAIIELLEKQIMQQ